MHSNDDAVAVKATTAGMDTEDVTLRDALLSTKKSCLKVRSDPAGAPAELPQGPAAAAAARESLLVMCLCPGPPAVPRMLLAPAAAAPAPASQPRCPLPLPGQVGTESLSNFRSILFSDVEGFLLDRGLVLYPSDGGRFDSIRWQRVRLSSFYPYSDEGKEGYVFDFEEKVRATLLAARDAHKTQKTQREPSSGSGQRLSWGLGVGHSIARASRSSQTSPPPRSTRRGSRRRCSRVCEGRRFRT